MNLNLTSLRCQPNLRNSPRSGSVLIIVLWVAFGLVSLALYFAHSMSLELRAADNRVAAIEAEQAISGAVRYLKYVLETTEEPGRLPDLDTYQSEEVQIGEATCWIIGRDNNQTDADRMYYGLVDEGSKLNLNSATLEMLEALPQMTPEIAAAIIDWRDTDSNATEGGAEDDVYTRLQPTRYCKNAPFESVEELRLVYGMDQTILFGEDANQNGVLDINENDGNASAPEDNMDGRLDHGLFEYVTVFSKQTGTTTNGTQQVNITNVTALQQLLNTNGLDATAIMRNFQRPGGAGQGGQGGQGGGQNNNITITNRSLLDFYYQSGMSQDDFMKIEDSITVTTVTNGGSLPGLVNVATACETVLACIPGIGTENAASLVSYRLQNPDKINSVAWLKEILPGRTEASQAGPYITGKSYQYSADIVALGHHGRGYRRVRFVLDTSQSTAQIVYKRDLTHLGMALGSEVLENIKLAKETQ